MVGLFGLIVLTSAMAPLAAPALLCLGFMLLRRFPGEEHLERWRLARSAPSRRRRIVALLPAGPSVPQQLLRGGVLIGGGLGRRGPPPATA